MLHPWDEFFKLAGAAGATLIGLLFVAITVATGFSKSHGVIGSRGFLTPALVDFCAVLFLSLAVLAPWPSVLSIGIAFGIGGIAGLAYQIHVILIQRKVDFAALDWSDRLVYSVAPAIAYVSMMAAGVGMIAEASFAPYAIAGTTTLLLITGIYGAWDLTLWLVKNRQEL
jgi:hypothetical protein